MTTYQPPQEDLSIFNSSVFTTANDASLTLSEAQSLFLGRTGTPTSTATSTSFSGGDIYIQGARVGLGGGNSTQNLAFGIGALQNNTSGTQNVAIGTDALKTNTLGYYNTAVGNGALQYNGAVSSSGFENVAVGNLSLNTNTTGIENVAVGAEALYANSSGSYNCGFGYKSGYKITTGSFNTSIGWLSGYTNTTGSNNVSIGGSTTVPVGTTTFSNITALGVNTVIGASSSTAIGYGATTTTANQIVLGTATETVYCVGTSATNGSLIASADIFVNGIVRAGVGKFKSGTDALVNTAFGRNALVATTSATNSCGVGNGALAQHTTGDGNTGVGSLAGNAIIGGQRNTAVGSACLKLSTNGNQNTAIGNASGQTISSGSNNTVCGYLAGGNIQSGSFNVCLGASANVSSGAVANSTAIGANSSVGNHSNSTAIGGGSATGAVCTTANQIMLGTTAETVECPGTASSISLKTARNISINGTVFGIGAADSNSLFSGLTTGAGNGAGNTLYGSGSYANFSDGSSARNTVIGALTMANTNTSYNDVTVLGYGCANSGFGTVDRITLLGATTSATANDSTAIGYGASATASNQIVLGRTSETVECVGTASSISLKASTNILVNGMVFGTGTNGVTNGNIFIGQTSGSNGNGLTNTVVGHNAFTSAINTSSQGNTFIGSNAGKDITATIANCTIVGQGSYANGNTTAYNGASCLGYDCQIGGANSTAIGTGATTTAANQIKLGRTTEFVECAGTNNTNGCLKLNGGLKLQTAYGAVPSATMLGYRIELSAIAISSFTSGTSQTIGSLALSVGVWSLNYTFELLADASVSTSQQAFFFSNQSGSAATYATRINNTGTTRFHSAITYANTDRPAYSGGGTYYASAAITLYPAINITFSTGALTGTGYASAVRIG